MAGKNPRVAFRKHGMKINTLTGFGIARNARLAVKMPVGTGFFHRKSASAEANLHPPTAIVVRQKTRRPRIKKRLFLLRKGPAPGRQPLQNRKAEPAQPRQPRRTINPAMNGNSPKTVFQIRSRGEKSNGFVGQNRGSDTHVSPCESSCASIIPPIRPLARRRKGALIAANASGSENTPMPQAGGNRARFV
ncbi:MAG TPA: hypothetical protein VHM90_21310 [Phycisphaerae bacterium]|nr:hypothetical protein [Phycisphaerae bacterium]